VRPPLVPRHRQFVAGVLRAVTGERDLLQVVLGRHAGGGFADFLHGRQQQADQDGDDGDHHQQLDQREREPTVGNPSHDELTLERRMTKARHSSRRRLLIWGEPADEGK